MHGEYSYLRHYFNHVLFIGLAYVVLTSILLITAGVNTIMSIINEYHGKQLLSTV